MKSVVFAYHNMGLAGLRALERAGIEIACIFSHEDDPDENCWFGSVKEWATEQAIPVYCPADVNQPEWIDRIAAFRPEMIFSFYYRQMLTEEILRSTATGRLQPPRIAVCPPTAGAVPSTGSSCKGETTDRRHAPSHGHEGRCGRHRRPEGSCPSKGRIPRSSCTRSSVMRRESSSTSSCL